ncbi:MAG: signal peptidase I [Oscillospiraceae bacterium]|jgi:signal peptidase I|nr:signal peptidase I [Oscillospiraceae bacterium]
MESENVLNQTAPNQSEDTDQTVVTEAVTEEKTAAEESAPIVVEGEVKADAQASAPKKTIGREILEWVVSILIAIALAFIIRTFLFEPIRVDGESMLATLNNNDYVIVTKPEYLLGGPQRFDVVICHYPNRTENFVKRLVGLPGDTVEMKNGYLTVNGVEYEEEYVEDARRPAYTGTWTLGDDEYFVLGDNRHNSNDSHLIGPIARDMIVGHVRLVVWPLSQMRVVK